jgi:hypothetical protein
MAWYVELGKLAGLAGLAIGIVLVIFREILKKDIFPQLNRDQTYRLFQKLIICTFAIGTIGILAWVIVPPLSARFSPKANGAYSVKVTVLNPQGIPVADAKIHNSLGGSTRKISDGLWEIVIDFDKKPASGQLTVIAWNESGSVTQDIALADEHNLSMTLRLRSTGALAGDKAAAGQGAAGKATAGKATAGKPTADRRAADKPALGKVAEDNAAAGEAKADIATADPGADKLAGKVKTGKAKAGKANADMAAADQGAADMSVLDKGTEDKAGNIRAKPVILKVFLEGATVPLELKAVFDGVSNAEGCPPGAVYQFSNVRESSDAVLKCVKPGPGGEKEDCEARNAFAIALFEPGTGVLLDSRAVSLDPNWTEKRVQAKVCTGLEIMADHVLRSSGGELK